MKSSNLKRNNQWKQAGGKKAFCVASHGRRITSTSNTALHHAGGYFVFWIAVMQKNPTKKAMNVEGGLRLRWQICCVARLRRLQCLALFEIMSLYLILEKWENIVFDSIGEKSAWVASRWLSELCYCRLSSVYFPIWYRCLYQRQTWDLILHFNN